MFTYALPRAIIFLLLSIVFAYYGTELEPSWQRTTLFIFAGLDIIWASVLFIAYFKKRSNN